VEITIKNNVLRLTPERAIFWQEESAVLLSDLHIGKIAHFRNEGIALPQHASQENFRRLDRLMEKLQPEKMIIIGDLFHSSVNREWDMFCAWRDQYPSVNMQVVLGNHDRLPKRMYDCANLEVHREELQMGPFILAHHPRREIGENEYVISGHIHPVVLISGMARQQLRFPCFYFGRQQAILPSFGYFTGGYFIEPEKEDTVVAVVKEKLVTVQAGSFV